MVWPDHLPGPVQGDLEVVLTVMPTPISSSLVKIPPDADHDVPRLQVTGISKSFRRNRALINVSLEVRPGEVHGLIGQNGCGKSTLAKVLTGFHAPDAGRVDVDGSPLRLPVRLREARARGMAVVHQNLGLVADQTGLENLRVGRTQPGLVTRRIDWERERRAVQPALARLGRQVPLDIAVRLLSEEDRATLAIARAVQDTDEGSGLIIFDESTRSLGRATMEHFYALVDDIVATGTSVLLISHGLEEVIQVADRVTVLRDGQVVEAGVDTRDLDETALARMVLGRQSGHRTMTPWRGATAAQNASSIDVAGLTGELVHGVDLSIRTGEVLGLTGLPDGGYGEVPYLLAGASKAHGGTLTWQSGQHIAIAALTVRSAMSHGIALVPEGREQAGLALELSVSDNIVLPHLAMQSRSGLPVDRALSKTTVTSWLKLLDVRPPNATATTGKLSGGNQQKVLLAKWLATKPQLLLLHEPTQAVDVGARDTLIKAIRSTAADGCAVLVAGSDENELALLCDRVLIVRGGRVTDELIAPLDPDDIVHLIFAADSRRSLRPSRETRRG